MEKSYHRNSSYYNSTVLFDEPHKITTGKIIENFEEKVVYINEKIFLFEMQIGIQNKIIYNEKIKIINKNKIYSIDIIKKSKKISEFLKFFNLKFKEDFIIFYKEITIPIDNFDLKNLIFYNNDKLILKIKLNDLLCEENYFYNFNFIYPIYYFYFNREYNFDIQYQDLLFSIYNITDKEFDLFILALDNKNIEFDNFISIFSNKSFISIYKNN